LRKELFDMVINSCEKIKFLYLKNIDHINIPQISEMIFNFNNYLKYLTLEILNPSARFPFNERGNYEEKLKISSEILEALGSKDLPLSLHYLDLYLIFDPNNLYTIFKICKQIKFKKLLIRNYNENI